MFTILSKTIDKLSISYRSYKAKKLYIMQNPYCEFHLIFGANVKAEVHHIFPVHVFKDLVDHPGNLISLCRKYGCHLFIGHSGNFQNKYRPEILSLIEKFKQIVQEFPHKEI